MNTAHPLQGRVALVVNGGRGDGATVALALADAGATLALLAPESCEILTVATLARLHGATTLGVSADLADAAAIDRAVEALHDQLGTIDIVVHTAPDDLLIQAFAHDLQAAERGGWLILLAETPDNSLMARGQAATGLPAARIMLWPGGKADAAPLIAALR